jgi:hypothetical protein
MNQTNEYTPVNTKTNVETLIIDDTSLIQPSSPSPLSKPLNSSSITITSDNFILGIPPFISSPSYHTQISRIHSLRLSSLSIFTYKLIPSSYLGQLMALHHELSPITYEQTYFKKYFLKSSYTTLGAFITINKEEFLIGFILYEIVSKKKFSINGVFNRYKYPCLMREDIPLNWRFDYSFERNPMFLERIQVNAIMNAGAIYLNGKYILVARVS